MTRYRGNIEAVRNLIRELGKTKAVVFSTHILEEVDAACTRAIIIDRGRIVAQGTPDELRGMSGVAGAVTVTVSAAFLTLSKNPGSSTSNLTFCSLALVVLAGADFFAFANKFAICMSFMR